MMIGEISGFQGDEYEDVFWDVASWSLVEIDRRFRGAYSLHHQGEDSNIILRRRVYKGFTYLVKNKIGPLSSLFHIVEI
jgi:hypothetical protein